MIKTLTFFSRNSYSNSFEKTYSIYIALKKENHDDIERRLIEELDGLKSNKGNIFIEKHWTKTYVFISN